MSIFSKIAVTDEERAAKAKEVMKAIASFSNSQNKQEYLYSYVPRAGIAQIKEHGLLSGNEIAKPENRHLLELARPNGDADKWLKEKDERLAKMPWKASYDGPSVLFGDLDPDKIHDKHPIKKFDAARIKIKLTDLLKDYPDTRMEGSELIPYTSPEELDALDEKEIDEFRHNRHHTLSPEEITALIARGQNPKDMWKDFKDTEGKFYASDVPHAHLITSIGKIPSKYIEFDEEQPVTKQAGLLKKSVHWSDDVSRNILNGKPYPVSYLTGELDELKESIKNRDWNNFKEEVEGMPLAYAKSPGGVVLESSLAGKTLGLLSGITSRAPGLSKVLGSSGQIIGSAGKVLGAAGTAVNVGLEAKDIYNNPEGFKGHLKDIRETNQPDNLKEFGLSAWNNLGRPVGSILELGNQVANTSLDSAQSGLGYLTGFGAAGVPVINPTPWNTPKLLQQSNFNQLITNPQRTGVGVKNTVFPSSTQDSLNSFKSKV